MVKWYNGEMVKWVTLSDLARQFSDILYVPSFICDIFSVHTFAM